MPGGRATSLSAESIYNFFAERMWRPSVLHWIGWPAAVACFVGALAGMWLFHHKTAKASFRLKFWLVVAAQVVVLVVYFAWIKPQL